MLYVTFAAFDAFFKAGGSPKVGLEIQPKTIADSTQVLMLQEYSEYVESWLDSGKIVECDRAQDSCTKKVLAANLDAFILGHLPEGEKVNKRSGTWPWMPAALQAYRGAAQSAFAASAVAGSWRLVRKLRPASRR